MRDDKDKVMEILFALFEKHQYYNIKVSQEKQRIYLEQWCKYRNKKKDKETINVLAYKKIFFMLVCVAFYASIME